MQLPAVGLGTWQTFDVGASPAERAPLGRVLTTFVELGGQVIDSSPMYGRSEAVAGDLIAKLGLRERLFIATKVWTTGQGRGITQMKESMRKLRAHPVDLMQVHNLVDADAHLETLAVWKQEGLVRYVGVTHYADSHHDEVARVIESRPLDFVQINYSAAERNAERRVLPAALERGVKVIVNRPFAGGELFRRLLRKKLPAFASDIGCTTWAQLLLKFVISHPAVTCAIPATSNAMHMKDNMRALKGSMPDISLRQKIAAALVLVLAFLPAGLGAQDTTRYTRADTLRGADGPARSWWDAQFYDLHVRVNPADSSVSGWNGIVYRVLRPGTEMQIDLQQPMQVDSMSQDRRRVTYRRDGDAFFVTLRAPQRVGEVRTLTVWFHGKPRIGRNLPWDGGFTFPLDSLGRQWIATADEGLGASVFWPLKDHLADEPDSQRIAVTVPDSLMDVSNGRLRGRTPNGDGTTTWEWFVVSPINSYNVTLNIGHYAHWSDTLHGENGPLTADYYPIDYHLAAARRQFVQVTPMLACFERWFGPYPWYEDGYKLIEVPNTGMEHQSAVSYGNWFENGYRNGYRGTDLSRTGLGLLWDYIIIHESAHEWWGNNVSAQDHADMWVHEGFAYYAEAIYTECQQGRTAGAAYIIGSRRGIGNRTPIVPAFGVNSQNGSGDMYPKGGNMLHTIRTIIDDDVKWRAILRGIQSTWRHRTVTGQQVRDYISREAGIDLSKVFEQYLNTVKIPVFDFTLAGTVLSYRWSNVVPGFAMPVRVSIPGNGTQLLRATDAWQTLTLPSAPAGDPVVDENLYVTSRNARAGER